MGPKLRRYLTSKRDPSESVFEFMQSMEVMAEEIAQKVIKETIESHQEGLKKELTKQTKKLLADFPVELKRAVKAKLDSMPHLKGAPGYTPIKGKDYFDGEDGESPVAGIDYFSRVETRALVIEFCTAAFDRMKTEGMTKTGIKKAIAGALSETMTPERIARSLEALPLIKKLDYEKGLKNRPGTPVQDTKQRTLHRGGGKETYYYDLSDQCNGVLKSFSIPSNARIVWVGGTDVPAGRYRKDVDFTGSGTTILTLTSAVAAPATGATLDLLYVK